MWYERYFFQSLTSPFWTPHSEDSAVLFAFLLFPLSVSPFSGAGEQAVLQYSK